MPYPNEHACRVNDPGKYERFARKNCEIKVDGKCVDVIYGIKKGGASEVQAYRYPKGVWTAEAARKHCREHGGTFEAAGEDATDKTPCVPCGDRIQSRWYALEVHDQVAEISIFDEIGGWGIPVAEFKRAFDQVRDQPELRLLINSPGGNVFDGMAMYNLLASVRSKLDVEVLGIAASIASVVALAGRKLTMGEGSYLMIHNPWALVVGDAEAMRETAEVLEKMGGELANIYAARSSLTKDEVLGKMDAETWFTASEAVEAGLADDIVRHAEVAALAFDLGRYNYRHVPGGIRATARAEDRSAVTERFVERALREAGCSRSTAELIASHGVRALRQGEPGAEQGEPGVPGLEAGRIEALTRNIHILGGEHGR